MTLQETLFSLRDRDYQRFQQKLIPNIAPELIIGIRTPQLRQLAKQLPDREDFKRALPHEYFEEDQLHAFLLAEGKKFEQTIAEVEAFLPYVDNWATCDQLNPKVFKKHRRELLPYICRWIESEHPYTVRFAIKMLMDHFLEEDFNPGYPEMVAKVQHEDYYVRMMIAWYFATGLAKQYDAVLSYVTEYRMEKWIHNKTIQKAVESFRIAPEQKEFLKTYRKK